MNILIRYIKTLFLVKINVETLSYFTYQVNFNWSIVIAIFFITFIRTIVIDWHLPHALIALVAVVVIGLKCFFF